MENSKREVVIDADFFNKFTEKDTSGQLFIKIMDEIGVVPVMHKYVYLEELHGNILAKSLVGDGIIKIYDYNDFITYENKRNYEGRIKILIIKISKGIYIHLGMKSKA